jgi:hypothetical protein
MSDIQFKDEYRKVNHLSIHNLTDKSSKEIQRNHVRLCECDVLMLIRSDTLLVVKLNSLIRLVTADFFVGLLEGIILSCRI